KVAIPWFATAIPTTVLGFMSARIVLGLTEGGNFPGAIKTVAEWFPTRERALATGIFNAGTNVGAVLCPIGVLWILEKWGWSKAFYITGALGFLWIVAWLLLYDSPEKHHKLSASERDYIKSDQHAAVEQKASVLWISLLGHKAVWAYLIAG